MKDDSKPMQHYINSLPSLDRLCRSLSGEKYLAVDTEFVSERNYFPDLGIIQVASRDGAWLIDTQVLHDLACFFALLESPSIVKITHAGRQDIEIFLMKGAKTVAPVFDTQIAAAFLGYADQISYGKLVELKAGVRLPKTETFTDWCTRPLTEKQIEYALADVSYLLPVYQKLHRELKSRGRLPWLEEECLALLNVAGRKAAPPEDTLIKVKGASSLDGRQLAVLEELYLWREEKAKRINVPRRSFLPDHIMLEIARRSPVEPSDLKRVRSMESRLGDADIEALTEAVRRGLERSGQSRAFSRGGQGDLAAGSPWVSGLLLAYVRGKAERERISSTLLATTEDVNSLLRACNGAGWEGVRLAGGWRRDFIGSELLGIVQGRSAVRLADGARTVALVPIEEGGGAGTACAEPGA